MRKKSLLSLLLLFVTSILLSGCIFPFWIDDGYGHGGRGGGHHDSGGHRGGGGGRR